MEQELIRVLDKAFFELNAIRARDGAPQHIDWHKGRPIQTSGCSEEYFSNLVDEIEAVLTKAKGVSTKP